MGFACLVIHVKIFGHDEENVNIIPGIPGESNRRE
jgi:hypothetical protein